MKNVTIAGRLTRDAVLRTMNNGDHVLGFSVAVDDRAGKEKTTLFFDASLFGKRGDALAQYLTKGSSVTVSGDLGKREHEGIHHDRLAPYTDHLGIAEGIETAVAATALTGTPCWAALNAQNLEGWIPPEGVAVTVFGDSDQSFTGASAAYRLARRLFAMGVKVRVEMPGTPGDDWNDVLLFMRENGRIAERLAA